MLMKEKLTSHGFELDPAEGKLGEMEDCNALPGGVAALRSRIAERGYLLLRGFLDTQTVLAARREILEQVAAAGGLALGRPLMDAIASGRGEAYRTQGNEYAERLITGPAYKAVCHHPKLLNWFKQLLDGDILAHDYFHLRIMQTGEASGFHYDRVYFFGTPNLYTCWIPLGAVPVEDGPLTLLEGSNHFDELIQDYGSTNVHRQADPRYPGGWLGKNPLEIQQHYGGRWLTTNFEPGDVVVFPMFTLHGSLDNRSPVNRLRLSSDSRYQLASEPRDERMIGRKPFWARAQQ